MLSDHVTSVIGILDARNGLRGVDAVVVVAIEEESPFGASSGELVGNFLEILIRA
jgi:hypothetical protein